MKVGIDLSSTNTGLVILSDDNELIGNGNFKLGDNSSQKPNRVFVRELFDVINLKRLNKLEKITIGIELSDFGNGKYADRFNFIAGALYQEHYCQEGGSISDFVCFNSNEGQRVILENYKSCVVRYEKNKKVYYTFYYKPHDNPIYTVRETFDNKRKLLKALSRHFTSWSCPYYLSSGTEDECDAYCIAYFLPQLRDRTQMHQEVKAKKVQAKKSKLAEKNEQIKKGRKENKLRQRQNKYLNIMASGKKLTKAQDRALDNVIKELKELE